MSRIIVDAQLSELLRKQVGPIEICDPTGQVIRKYIPDPDRPRFVPEFSKEELDRARKEPGRPLKDIIADLEARG